MGRVTGTYCECCTDEIRAVIVEWGHNLSFDRRFRLPDCTHVFISYAHLDVARVEPIYNGLIAAGFQPWMDTRDLVPGEVWQDAIRRALEKSHFFVACLSPNSVDRIGWVQRELKIALDLWDGYRPHDIFIIPVKLEPCDIPERLGAFQTVDFFTDNGWERLIRALNEGCERRHMTPPIFYPDVLSLLTKSTPEPSINLQLELDDLERQVDEIQEFVRMRHGAANAHHLQSDFQYLKEYTGYLENLVRNLPESSQRERFGSQLRSSSQQLNEMQYQWRENRRSLFTKAAPTIAAPLVMLALFVFAFTQGNWLWALLFLLLTVALLIVAGWLVLKWT